MSSTGPTAKKPCPTSSMAEASSSSITSCSALIGTQGCKHCSFWADNFNGIIVHLNHRDVTMVAVSRAPYSKLAAYKKRMGWSFKWVSSGDTDFNFDYHVSFTPEEMAKKQGVLQLHDTRPG